MKPSGGPMVGGNTPSASHARAPCAEANFTVVTTRNHANHSHIQRRCAQYRGPQEKR